MKNIQIYLIAAVFFIALVGIFLFQKNPRNDILIGAILPLSGNSADQGEWVKNGLDLAVAQINQASGAKIKILYEDSQGVPTQTISAYEKLRLENHISIVITWGSGVGLALTPLVNRDHVVQMGVATAADAYSTPDDFTFRNFPSASSESDFLSSVVFNQLHAKKTAVIKINNDYGVSSAVAFKKAYEGIGGAVIAEESFESGASDFRSQLTKVKTAHSDIIYIASYPMEGGLLLRQAKELSITTPFIASVAIMGGKSFFDAAGGASQGLLVVSSVPVSTASNPEVAEFVKAYSDAFSAPQGGTQLYAARAYDALKILAVAARACNVATDTECIKQKLFATKAYKGAGGSITFDKNGDITAGFHLLKVENGSFVNY